jgi:hypothetical protein
MGSSDGLPVTGGAAPPGMAPTCSRGRAEAMNSRQMPAGTPPPVTPFMAVLSSLPTHTAVTKPEV